ncbi:Uncharacterised protein [Burkholderia pseudomallei]|nr:Uncharacterised protein [Burkholderia pseudomallei]
MEKRLMACVGIWAVLVTAHAHAKEPQQAPTVDWLSQYQADAREICARYSMDNEQRLQSCIDHLVLKRVQREAAKKSEDYYWSVVAKCRKHPSVACAREEYEAGEEAAKDKVEAETRDN